MRKLRNDWPQCAHFTPFVSSSKRYSSIDRSVVVGKGRGENTAKRNNSLVFQSFVTWEQISLDLTTQEANPIHRGGKNGPFDRINPLVFCRSILWKNPETSFQRVEKGKLSADLLPEL